MKPRLVLLGSAVIAMLSTANADAATLLRGSDVTLTVGGASSTRGEPQFGGALGQFPFGGGLLEKPIPSQSATVTVGDDDVARLFLNGTTPETVANTGLLVVGAPPAAEDYRITASANGLTFTAADSHISAPGVGAISGEFFEVLLVSGLTFQDRHALSDVIIAGVGDGVSLPTLIGVTDSGVWLDLASLGVNAPDTAFTVSFATQAPPQVVPLPATAPLMLAGLAALRLVRRRRDA